jgi:hypothetical protein
LGWSTGAADMERFPAAGRRLANALCREHNRLNGCIGERFHGGSNGSNGQDGVISEEMLFYCRQRGLSAEEVTALVVNGLVKHVLQQLPMEFAVEAQKLISVSLEGSVG